MCTPRELQDGTYSLDDLADMHEALDMRDELLWIVKANQEKN